MEPFERIRQIACRLDLDRFVMAHGGLYLLGTFPREEDLAKDGWSFTTQPRARVDELMKHARADGGKHLLAGRFLYKVEKSEKNPFKGRISVGRANNNDIVIRHPSISKLHAHFISDIRQSQIGHSPMTLRLLDAGSSNGTFLNGERLEPEASRPTGTGDTILFGEVRCELLDAGALHQKIRAIFPTPNLLGQ